MSNRTVRTAQKRAQRRISKSVNTLTSFARLTNNNGLEDRAEALSTIKRVNVVRG